MQGLVDYLLLLEDQKREREQLEKLGLTPEEIDGYFEFYLENYYKVTEMTKQ